MKSKFVCICLILMALAIPAFSEDKAKPQEMSPEMKAMMDAWMKYATPGPGHKHLESMVGKWNTVSHMVMPGQEPTATKGTCDGKMVLGGRFLMQECKSEFMGQPFEGMGMTGYDNYQQKYMSTWVDSMGTMMMISTGTASADGKTVTMSGDYMDPMTNAKKTYRTVWVSKDANNSVFEMYEPGPDGKEMKSFWIEYSRP